MAGPTHMRVNSRTFAIAALLVLGVLTVSAGQHTLEEVAAGLRAHDPATRLRAIQILRDAGYPEAAGPLAAALADPDDRLKLEAIDAERSLFMTRPIAHRKMIGFVIEVRTPDVGGQAFAADQMALLPRRVPPEVLAGLAQAMRSPNPRVRLGALNLFGALAPLGGPAAEDAVRSGVSWTIEALRRGNRTEQVAAAAVAGRALKDCGTTMAASPDPSGSLCAEIGNALVDAVNNRDPQARRAAMASLGQLRYPNAAQALADQLGYYQRGPDARAALEGLAGIGDPASLDIFKRLLNHGEAAVRRLAVEGLARAGSRDDLPDLERMGATEKSGDVLLAIHYATLKLGAQAKPDQLVRSLRNTALRPLALQYLLDLSPSIAPTLADALQDRNPDTRMLVADVLGFSRSAAIVPRLEAAVKDPDRDTARAAQRAIDRITLERP
jgi:HEAT repeat protein